MFTLNSVGAAPLRTVWNDQPAVPLATEGNFAEQFARVQTEVQYFIENGSGDAMQAGVSPEGWRIQQGLASPDALNGSVSLSQSKQAFVQQLAPYAQAAAQKLGVDPKLLIAHAALESGWGQHPLRRADGSNTFNLFGIKATRSWQGEVNWASTHEYVAGRQEQRQEPFRAYPDLQSAFADYTEMLATHPRYRSVLGVGGDTTAFASALKKAGYASDPDYDKKLMHVSSTLKLESS